eukprot:scaffold48897_cov59-Phaeocystis_antarctica.AAC.2
MKEEIYLTQSLAHAIASPIDALPHHHRPEGDQSDESLTVKLNLSQAQARDHSPPPPPRLRGSPPAGSPSSADAPPRPQATAGPRTPAPAAPQRETLDGKPSGVLVYFQFSSAIGGRVTSSAD